MVKQQTFNLLILGSNPNASKYLMLLPIQLHIKELKLRLSYFCISFVLCFFILLNYNESVFFVETYVLSYSSENSFIATHVTEILTTAVYVCVNFSLIFTFPYMCYHIKSFCKASWYQTQVWFFTYTIIYTYLVFLFGILLCYFFILPHIFTFLSSWKTTLLYALKIELEARIETYIYWTLRTSFFLSNTVFLVCFKLYHSYLMNNMVTTHISFRKYKKFFVLSLCFFTTALVPLEIFFQLIFILCITFLMEIFFFATCVLFAKNNV